MSEIKNVQAPFIPVVNSQKRNTNSLLETLQNNPLVQKMVATINLWLVRSHERHILMNLDDRMLEDIGITRDNVMKEYDKPFWKN